MSFILKHTYFGGTINRGIDILLWLENLFLMEYDVSVIMFKNNRFRHK